MGAAAPCGHANPQPQLLRRRLAAAAALLALVLLAFAATKLLPPVGLRQPIVLQQLLQAARGASAPLAAASSPRRQLRVPLVGHDLALTIAPQVLHETALHLRAQGHSIR